MSLNIYQLYSDLSVPDKAGWSWHLLTFELNIRVAKASKGHYPLPFLISNLRTGANVRTAFNLPNLFQRNDKL